MILVPVSNDKALDLVNIFFQICDVRDDQVDAEHIILGERQAAVDDNNAVLIFESGDVHTNLFQSAQGYDPELWGLFCFFLQISSIYRLSRRIPISSRLSLNKMATAEISASSSTIR